MRSAPSTSTLRQGEFFSVVGPSGCGKSTLLDVIAGLASPSSGTVTFEGRAVAGRVPDGVGVVFQEDASFPWLTSFDNAAFALRRAGLPETEVRERVEHTLSFMGLMPFAEAYPAQLSGGMRQRVCIARTLVTRPRLLLLDEPFGALDQQTRLLMGDELLKLWRETGATILLITHSLDEATLLSDRVGVMSARPGVFIDLVETGWPRRARQPHRRGPGLRPHHRPALGGAARPIHPGPGWRHGDPRPDGSALPSSAAPSRSSRRPAGSASSAGTR